MADNERIKQNLLAKGDLNEVGTWLVYGEDDNPDWGGQHISSLLFTLVGTYREAVEAALKDLRFTTWGAGGYISKNITIHSKTSMNHP